MELQRRTTDARSVDLVMLDDGTVVRAPREGMGTTMVRAAASRPSLGLLALTAGGAVLLPAPAVALLATIWVVVAAGMVITMRSRRMAPDSDRAREVLTGLPTALRSRIGSVLSMADDVRAALDRLPFEPSGVRAGIDELTITLLETAQRVAQLDRYLAGVSRDELAARARGAREVAHADGSDAGGRTAAAFEEQVAVIDRLRERRRELDAQIEQIAASLGAIHAQLVQAGAEAGSMAMLDDELLDLRDRTRALAQGFAEVQAAAALSPAAVAAVGPPPGEGATSPQQSTRHTE